MATIKRKKVKGYDPELEMEKIAKLFAELEKDKSLPTFPDFFMMCLILGVAEQVNLKKMYPKTYLKFSKMLERHNVRIRAMQ